MRVPSPPRPPLLAFLLCLLLAASASAADIPLNSTLYANDPNSRWASPNNTFALSFVPSAPAGTLIAAVSYSTIPIWQAGPSTNSSAVLRLLPSGDLQLLPAASSTTPLWSSSTAALGVTAAELQESGNFVLKNSSGATVWASFDQPTDTIVPTQQLNANHTLTSGLYSFKIKPNGNLTLLWNNTITYYNLGLNSTANSNLSNPILEIRPTGILTLSDPSLNSDLDLAYSSDYAEESDVFRIVKLDNDGNLRIHSFVQGSGTLTAGWAAVSDQCQVYGFCGNNGICSYNETSPICGCPSQNFEFIDSRDTSRGCKRTRELQDCSGQVAMLQLDHTEFLTFEPELDTQVFYMGNQPCNLNCLNGASCVASTSLSDGSGQCFLKTSSFVSGFRTPAIPSTSYVKVCAPVLPNPSPAAAGGGGRDRWRLRAWVVVVAVLATLFVLALVEGGFWWWCIRNNTKFSALSSQYALLEYASGAPVQFSYKELQKATKGFKEKLGEGGFGAVYKGVLANRSVAAVKQLEGIEQGEKQFRMEVATISSTHHLNLVRLIGFCSEGRHRLLVYEFMKNGSLDSFLFAPEEQSGKHLNWENRYSVALGTARGITYLHEECRDCIVHCDIKPENILLDENYCAKVSDFGLAKLVNPKDHRYRTLTSVRGTRGYLAPEWLANLPITSKSDVYSYGMVLLEIVSGKRNFEVSAETNHKKFSLWAYEEFEKGNVEAVVDRRLLSHEIDMEQVRRAVVVSFWCIQEQPSQRPMMGKVVQMLEGIMEIERPPAPKAAAEGSVGGTSVTASSVSALSTFAASMPVPSSSSSLQMAGVSPFASGKHGGERGTSSMVS
ncbi:G-type lectin S-receptor-like serine/threonine-protein kinase At1g34300 [Salvia miltiorrhiza]|uniref:G-type lectin S-receptor-like serine/threonine-protein kinase At1g34300 n=1 Tax=Salvia miltiorrhiza TaxID=226208 RepID=UPI0025ACECF9|nr:G-type lectin S-receptor-like serine/threonine-protein kinase At1g34300 [Salvia miltiorrhiza]